MRLGILSMLGPMLLAIPVTAYATTPPTGAVRLAWVRGDAAQDCLSANELESELIDRMGKNPFEGAPRQWIEGFVTRHGEHYEVQLFERDANGKTVGSRKLSEASKSCRSLDEPIVLAIALIIDPNVKLRQRSTPTGAASALGVAPRETTTTALTPSDQTESTGPRPVIAAAQLRSALPNGNMAPSNGDANTTPSNGNVMPSNGNVGATPVLTNTASRNLGQGSDAVATSQGRRLLDAPTKNQSEVVREDDRAANVAVDARATELQAGAVFVHGLLPRTAWGVELGSRVASGPYAVALSLRWYPEQRTEQRGEFGFGATQFGLDACHRLAWHRLHWTNCLEFGAGAIHVTVHRPVPLKPGDRLTASAGANTGLGLPLFGPLSLDARLFGAVSLNPWEFRVVDSKVGEAASVFEQSWLMLGGAIALTLRVF